MMDWVVSQAIATVIAFSNGHASIHLSTDGGFIGGGESHESVRKCSEENGRRCWRVPAALQHATSEYPLSQQQGKVLFYLLTEPEFSLPVLIGQRVFSDNFSGR